MEEQFVLRVPERLRERMEKDIANNKLDGITIKMISRKEALLSYDGKSYNGHFVDLPCIVESHKTLDNKQFIKVADISKLLVFSEDGKREEDLGVSGLTPPMKYVKQRRFRKRLTKAPIVEEIEKAVAKLLEKDREAVRVDVQVSSREGKDSEGEDVSSLAAEIELNLLESEKMTQNTEENVEGEEVSVGELVREKEEALRGLLSRLEEKRAQLQSVVNVIVKKRFEEAIEQLERQREELEKEILEITKKM